MKDSITFIIMFINIMFITIHYIYEHYDEGDTIFQAKCPVLPDDSAIDVAQKVHSLEYKHYPLIIERTILGK